jgi:hypothetical protein
MDALFPNKIFPSQDQVCLGMVKTYISISCHIEVQKKSNFHELVMYFRSFLKRRENFACIKNTGVYELINIQSYEWDITEEYYGLFNISLLTIP